MNETDLNMAINEDDNQGVRVSYQYYNKIKIAELASLFFSIYGMFLSILLHEMVYTAK